MRWSLIALGILLVLIVAVVLVGAMSPRDHIVAMSARIAAAPDSVWSALTDAAAFPTWRSDVSRVEILPSTATGPSWRELSRQGAITMVVDTADPPRRLVVRIADKNLPYGGTWEYRVDPDGPTSSVVTIVERGSVYNPVFRFVSRFVIGHTATIDGYLRALGKRFGGEATPAEAPATGATHGI